MRPVDTFAIDSSGYRAARPTYPPELFGWLASIAPARERAWDCATGNGQAAVALSAHFARVDGTDLSQEQIAQAVAHPQVHYAARPAEHSALKGASVDVVAIAQALHWFAHDAFFDEARRVLKPDGVIAAWGYGELHAAPEFDRVLEREVLAKIDAYWADEIRLLRNAYRDIRWPFDDIETPSFSMGCRWRLNDLLLYLKTWSAWKRYVQHQADAGFEAHVGEVLAHAWPGDAQAACDVRFDFVLRVGRMRPASTARPNNNRSPSSGAR